ncbi:MAG: flagellar biosynthesis protein FlhF [Gammaproteobacteria bacterium]|nr:flagellar biosynthesis protein FlhF [Gammaproteobacteria bacterium]
MTPKVFIGSSTTDALLQVRTEFGPDAIVLSTRETNAGIEVVAVSQLDAHEALADMRHDVQTKDKQSTNSTKPANSAKVDRQSAAGVSGGELRELFQEIRGLVKDRLSQDAWTSIQNSSEQASEALRILLQCGFSAELCGELVDEIRSYVRHVNEPVIDQLRTLLERRIQIVDPMKTFDGGGVFALVGPTGVGKTTLTAKIAARCVLRFGRENVSILSTDNFRIGAFEQIKTYGKIIGVPVFAVKDADDLSSRVSAYSRKAITLIDTAGVSQRDVQMLEQLTLLSGSERSPKLIAVVSATTNLLTVEEVFRLHNLALSRTGDTQLHSVIITKTDEAGQIGPVIDAVIRHRLSVMFIGTGQQVPDDLSSPDAPYLAYRSLTPQPSGAVGEVPASHVPALLRDQLSAWSSR